MIGIIGPSGGMLPGILSGIFLLGIGFLGGLFSVVGSIFGSKKATTTAQAEEKARQHEILMAKQAAELAKQKAVTQAATGKKTMMYVGIGGGAFVLVMMMMMMMRK